MTIRSDLIPVGSPAPDFSCALSDGSTLALSALRGSKRVILVFYPGDNTPVCTAQLCAFRDDWSRFQSHDTLVYGVNPAGRDKHAQFANRHQFPFPILVDAGGKVGGAYGCLMLFRLIRRTVYLIDKQGRIAFAQRGNPAPQEILRVLETLQDDDVSDF